MTLRRVVVVGAGVAGVTAIRTLRDEGFEGEIVLVGDEPVIPYARPPLSKRALGSGPRIEEVALLAPEDFAALDIDFRAGTRAIALDVGAREITTALGEVVGFDALVIATGARARTPPWTRGVADCRVLRSFEHAQQLHAAFADTDDVLIIGAGFLGTEIAATARSLGKHVTLVDVQAFPMQQQLGAMVSQRLAALHHEHGVQLACGTAVERIAGDRAGVVHCASGSRFDAGMVIVAAGAEPAVEWMRGSGVDVADGVACDVHCRAAPNVFVAGDVARWPSALFGRTVRIEHQMNAVEQAAVAARNLVGRAERYDPVPFFWSDQYDVKIQVHGLIESSSVTRVLHGDLEADRFVIGYFDAQDTLRAVLGWNATREVRRLRAGIGAHAMGPMGTDDGSRVTSS